MGIGVGDFNRVAGQGGQLRINDGGNLVSRGTSFRAKVVQWRRARAEPGVVRAENRRVPAPIVKEGRW